MSDMTSSKGARERNPDCRILVIANQKGGVGKTTTAVNLAAALATVGRKVLLLDLDPQGNASSGLGLSERERTPSAYDVLVNETPLSEAVRATFVPNLDILPSVVDLSAIDIELATMPEKEYVLKDAINDFHRYYDDIIMDTPPSLGLLTVNALASATEILIPLQCEYYALEGLSHLLHTISLIQEQVNPALTINGVVLTMYDRRNRLTRDVEHEVCSYLQEKVYKTRIPRNVRLSEAPSHGQPAIIYDHRSAGAQAYLSLAREVLQREKASKDAASSMVDSMADSAAELVS